MIELRDYQVAQATKACAIIQQYGLAYLPMEVRTGKTLTALHVANLLGKKEVLFVTKKKAISSIDKDAVSYGVPYNMAIVNFEQLHKVQPGFDFVIIDEAHSIGAFPKPSQRAEELRRICSNGCHVLYLSGTPTPETWSQIFHQFWITEYSPWNHCQTFYKWVKDGYVTPGKIYVYNREVADYSDANIDRIQKAIAHLMLPFTQQDAGFAELVEDVVLTVPMPPKVAACLQLLKKDRLFTTKSGGVVLADTAVKYMNKVHQICSGSVIDEDGTPHAFDDFKAQFIKSHFAGKKIAIFYKFTAELIHLTNTFGKESITQSPDEFQNSNRLVFVSQIQSGREGVNLSTADVLVMYNIDYSAVSYWQARARLQSKDRADPAKVYWIMTEGGIEQQIFDVVHEKKDFTLRHFNKYATMLQK